MNESTENILAHYLPNIVVQYLHEKENGIDKPKIQKPGLSKQLSTRINEQRLGAAILFADISKFTSLSESLAQIGTRGVEILANYLNKCFTQLVRLVSKAGGDVIKFAGDAVIVMWPVDEVNNLQQATQRAIQSAIDIQETLPNENFYQNKTLQLKIGIGCGEVSMLHIGGEVNLDGIVRKEVVAIGNPLNQSFEAEKWCQPGDIVVSRQSWNLVHDFFKSSEQTFPNGNVRIVGLKKVIQKRKLQLCTIVPPSVKDYIPLSVQSLLESDHSKKDWISEIRLVSVIFINFGFDEEEIQSLTNTAGRLMLNDCFRCVQRAVFNYEGTINKFLIDDKGVTTLAAFGLPPNAHENDATRAVLASLGIGTLLHEKSLAPCIGVASGNTFCGVIGHTGGRKEYTVIGDTVNLASRLVQYAQREALLVVTDATTQYLSQNTVDFERLSSEIKVKGKKEAIRVYFPYRQMVVNPTHESDGVDEMDDPNVFSTIKIASEDRLSMQLMPSLMTRGFSNIVGNPTDGVLDDWRAEWKEQVFRYTERRVNYLTHSKHAAYVVPIGPAGDSTLTACNRILSAFHEHDKYGVLLQGDIGSGKSRVISKLYNTLSMDMEKIVFCCTGNPFERGSLTRPFGVWIDIIKEAIEIELKHATLEHMVAEPTEESKHKSNTSAGSNTPFRKASATNTMIQNTKIWGKSQQLVNINQIGNPTATHAIAYAPKRMTRTTDSEDPTPPENARENILLGWLGLAGNTAQEVMEYKHLLNPLLDVYFPGPSSSDGGMDTEFNKQQLVLLFVELFRGLTVRANMSIYCLIDDAMHLDVESLRVTYHLANAPFVFIVMASRSVDSQTFPAPEARELCVALLELPTVQLEEMPPLNRAQVGALTRSTLGVLTVPSAIEDTIYIKSRGNPLFVREIIRNMLVNEVLRVDTQKQICYTSSETATVLQKKSHSQHSCTRCHSKFNAIKRRKRCKSCGLIFCSDCAPQNLRKFVLGYDTPQRHCIDCFSGNTKESGAKAQNVLNVDVQPPVSIETVVGTWLDRLPIQEQIILKVASVAQKELEFAKQTVVAAFPLSDVSKEEVEECFDNLVEKNFFARKITLQSIYEEKSEKGKSAMNRQHEQTSMNLLRSLQKQDHFQFVHYLMPEVILLRLPLAQREELYKKVAQSEERHAKVVRKLFWKSTREHLKKNPLKAGYILVSKQNPSIKGLGGSNNWKKRWAVLSDNRIELFGDESCDTLKESLLLSGAYVDKRFQSEQELEITVQSIIRGGVAQQKTKSYYFSFGEYSSPKIEMDAWEYMIKFAVESAEPPQLQASQTGGKIHRRRSSFSSLFRKENRMEYNSSLSDLDEKKKSKTKRKKSRMRNQSWFGTSSTPGGNVDLAQLRVEAEQVDSSDVSSIE